MFWGANSKMQGQHNTHLQLNLFVFRTVQCRLHAVFVTS
jgi:hypothetical protein